MPKCALGLDIGGTKSIAGLVTEKGEIIRSSERKTYSILGADRVMSTVYDALDDVMASCSRSDLAGFGVATAGWGIS